MTAPEGLPKYERICKENDIQKLFDQGVGFSAYPSSPYGCSSSGDCYESVGYWSSTEEKQSDGTSKAYVLELWNHDKSAEMDLYIASAKIRCIMDDD